MIVAPKPVNEAQRLAALYEYDIMDTLPQQEYDDITHIAARICQASGSLIGLIDSERQWFLSKIGLEGSETPRDLTFCSHAILDPYQIMIVPDSTKDRRFFDHPMVIGEPNICFYAGIPLLNREGHALGTLCVIDSQPKMLNDEQKQTLLALSRQIVTYMEVRRLNNILQRQKDDLQQTNKELERFAYVVAHDMKSPCASLVVAADYLNETIKDKLDPDSANMLELMQDASAGIVKMIDGILKHTLAVNASDIKKETFSFGDLAEEVRKLLTLPQGFRLEVAGADVQVHACRSMLHQVLLNLCSNAIKYNDSDKGLLKVAVTEQPDHYLFSVQDNGRGIAPENQKKIFDLFSTLGSKDRDNNKGYGIGLATVSRLVNKLGGVITVVSEPGKGSTFSFTVHK